MKDWDFSVEHVKDFCLLIMIFRVEKLRVFKTPGGKCDLNHSGICFEV